jgi:hypothetical protein
MTTRKKYKKPQITRVKLSLGEAVMGTCSSTTQRTKIVKTSNFCYTADVGSCRTPVS